MHRAPRPASASRRVPGKGRKKMKLTFQWFGFSSPQMHAALDIRTKVFVDEQGYTLEDDRDEQDKTALHVLGYDAAGVHGAHV